MLNSDVKQRRRVACCSMLLVLAVVSLGLPQGLVAQSDGGDSGSCNLKNHVYTCDGAAFQAALSNAKTVVVEAHNSDGIAGAQLKDLVTKKLAKTIAPEGGPADLVFLLIPLVEPGINNVSGNVDLGTLSIYSASADGTRGHLLWAETFSGSQDLPWPAVVHGLILQFQSRFHIK